MSLGRVTVILSPFQIFSPSLVVVEEGSPGFLFHPSSRKRRRKKKTKNKQVEKQKGKNLFSLNQQENCENIDLILSQKRCLLEGQWGGSFCHQKKEQWSQFQHGTEKSGEACCIAPHNSLPHCLLRVCVNCWSMIPPLSLILSQELLSPR